MGKQGFPHCSAPSTPPFNGYLPRAVPVNFPQLYEHVDTGSRKLRRVEETFLKILEALRPARGTRPMAWTLMPRQTVLHGRSKEQLAVVGPECSL